MNARSKISLTLVAVDCAYPALAAKALQRSAARLPAVRVLLLTDVDTKYDGVETKRIAPIKSREAYSQFMLKQLVDHIDTDYALVVQWDGFVIHDNAFADEFWNYDYIGARWPHVPGEFKVGNGGFSLRSKKLLNALRDDEIIYRDDQNEDESICIHHRELLENKHGIQFADERVADRFAFDVSRPIGRTLGFHGVFNFWRVLSNDELIAFARTVPERIAEGLGFSALSRNLTDLKRHDVAREFITRLLASKPHDVQALDMKAKLNEGLQPVVEAAAANGPVVAPPKARNDPCPCGSGKRYKECHGKAAVVPLLNAPINVDALTTEALQLHQNGNIQGAVERYTRILAHAPENPNAMHYIGLAQYQNKQFADALEPMWQSLTLVSSEPEMFSNYSAAAWSRGRYAEGQWAAERALALNPNHARALSNLGFNLRSTNQIDASIAAYDRALEITPDFNYARWSRAFSLLAKGDYVRGFADYELRITFPETQPSGKIPANTPIWRGEAAVGKTILLICEQGLGDTFMFARFIPMVIARGLTITFAVQKSQLELMRQSFPDVTLVIIGEHEALQFDYWVALWSLAPALGITMENLPAPRRFLQTREADVAKWRARLAAIVPSPSRGGLGRGWGSAASEIARHSTETHLTPSLPLEGGAADRAITIGLVWQGQFAGTDDQMADRSIPPRLMSKFIDDMSVEHPEIIWVSLQHGAPPLANKNVIDWTNDTVEFTQMAALIDALDVVITIDTGAAHLAAALGANTWVLLREAGDWRYGTQEINGDTCAWSPTMRLFRQDKSRRWEPVFGQIANALRKTS